MRNLWRALSGWIAYYLLSAFISWTGAGLNGNGNTQSIMRILAYALFPSILGLIIVVPQIAICGNEMFKADNVVHDL